MNERVKELEYYFTYPPGVGNNKQTNATPNETSKNNVNPETNDNKFLSSSSSSSSSSSRGLSDDYVFVYDEEKRPLVVLLGWAGCQDKYLAKYSAIYEEKGCITLRCTAPLECLFWRRHRLPAMSRRLFQVIVEKCPNDRPVFFHVFSNGGAIFYQHISMAMQQADSTLKVKGMIFDSSPGQRRIMSLYRAVSAIFGGHPLLNLPVSFAYTLFLSIFWFTETVMQFIGNDNTVFTDPVVLVDEPYTCPQLFLYSKADALVRSIDIEKFAERRAERGVRTKQILFADSPHVKHFATYRDVYVSSVCGFISECLDEREAGDKVDKTVDDDDDKKELMSRRESVRKRNSQSRRIDDDDADLNQ